EDDSRHRFPRIEGTTPFDAKDPYAYIMAAYEVPPSPDYIPGPEVPSSSNYIPGPEEPQSPPPLDFIPELMYPEYMPQRMRYSGLRSIKLPAAACLTPLQNGSPGYVSKSDPEEDDERSRGDLADYPLMG
ncbi:hypothetical protein Tco_0352236, partial [Tanacetum coccineum]